MRPNLSDAALNVSGALPNGATTSTVVFDTATSNRADQSGRMEYEIQAPALTTGQLADAATMTYAVLMSANADGSSPVLIYDKVLVQTGAGGVGQRPIALDSVCPTSPAAPMPTCVIS